MQQVRILNLYNNGIADAGAIVLAKALGKHSTITSLSLRSNHVADYGLQAQLLKHLEKSLKTSNHSTLIHLNPPQFTPIHITPPHSA